MVVIITITVQTSIQPVAMNGPRVTNKHLIQDSKTGEFTLTEGDRYNKPIRGSAIERQINNFSRY